MSELKKGATFLNSNLHHREKARMIKATSTLKPDCKKINPKPCAVCGQQQRIADLEAELAARKAYDAANPLGGPAVVLEAAAWRLRAGEGWHAVLADYGLQSTPEPCAAELEAIITGATIEGRTRLLVNVLRWWPEAEQRRLALHLLGDDAQTMAGRVAELEAQIIPLRRIAYLANKLDGGASSDEQWTEILHAQRKAMEPFVDDAFDKMTGMHLKALEQAVFTPTREQLWKFSLKSLRDYAKDLDLPRGKTKSNIVQILIESGKATVCAVLGD